MSRLRTADSSVVRERSILHPEKGEVTRIVQLPLEPVRQRSPVDARQLSQVLFETAGLLAESLESGDAEFRDEVIDLAVRSLRVAGTVIERRLESPSPPLSGV
jgi:hypothetical protein